MQKASSIKSSRAKRSLGQNFLQNKSIASAIVRAADVDSEDIILEIGPGKGILTEELLEKAGEVVAIEKDDLLFENLSEKFKESKNLELIHGDVLKTKPNFEENYKVVANIPYNITGEIIKKFLTSKNQPKLIALLVQYEVAKRIVAKDGKESILSVSVKAYGKPKLIKKVKKENFLPQPKIDSAILIIENISRNFFKDLSEEKFFRMVKTGFSQKRKKLKNTLKPVLGERLEEVFKKAGINSNLRAEKLGLEDWKKLVSN